MIELRSSMCRYQRQACYQKTIYVSAEAFDIRAARKFWSTFDNCGNDPTNDEKLFVRSFATTRESCHRNQLTKGKNKKSFQLTKLDEISSLDRCELAHLTRSIVDFQIQFCIYFVMNDASRASFWFCDPQIAKRRMTKKKIHEFHFERLHWKWLSRSRLNNLKSISQTQKFERRRAKEKKIIFRETNGNPR